MRPNYSFATVTVSDKGAAGERADRSGPLLGELLLPWGDIVRSMIVPDEHTALAAELRCMVEEGIDAIFTSGGTGLSPRDITPEATLEVVERLVPGIAEAMRRESFSATPAMLRPARKRADAHRQRPAAPWWGMLAVWARCSTTPWRFTGRGGRCGAGQC